MTGQDSVPGGRPEKVDMNYVRPLLANDAPEPHDGPRGDPEALEMEGGNGPGVDFYAGVIGLSGARVDRMEGDKAQCVTPSREEVGPFTRVDVAGVGNSEQPERHRF
jgi:hypothetical protein